MLRQLGRLPDRSRRTFHTMVVITIRQKATSSADVLARLTKVDANEKTMIVTATAAAPSDRARTGGPVRGTRPRLQTRATP